MYRFLIITYLFSLKPAIKRAYATGLEAQQREWQILPLSRNISKYKTVKISVTGVQSITQMPLTCLQIHKVSSTSVDTIRTRITSCYCSTCLSGELHSDFSVTVIQKSAEEAVRLENSHEPNLYSNSVNTEATTVKEILEQNISYVEHDWVAVMYENQWHVGQMEEIDEAERDCLVSNLRRTGGIGGIKLTLKWPTAVDEIWVNYSDIFK